MWRVLIIHYNPKTKIIRKMKFGIFWTRRCQNNVPVNIVQPEVTINAILFYFN